MSPPRHSATIGRRRAPRRPLRWPSPEYLALFAAAVVVLPTAGAVVGAATMALQLDRDYCRTLGAFAGAYRWDVIRGCALPRPDGTWERIPSTRLGLTHER